MPIARMRRVYAGPNAASRSRIRAEVLNSTGCFGHLTGDPLRRRIAGNTDPDQLSSHMSKNREAVEQSERDSTDYEQIDRSDSRGVIAQESLPALRPRYAQF
jgi:hypothetical protein